MTEKLEDLIDVKIWCQRCGENIVEITNQHWDGVAHGRDLANTLRAAMAVHVLGDPHRAKRQEAINGRKEV